MTYLSHDAYGHRRAANTGTLGTALAAAAVGVTTAGTISGTTAAGAAPTVTAVSATDTAGTFTLNPVTGGGAQAAGAVATVTFAQPYAATPAAVVVTMCDNAAGASGVAVASSAQSVTTSGFTVNVASALTTAHNYNVYFSVIA